MATTLKWTTPESLASALTTGLDSLAAAATAITGTAIDNATGLYTHASLEFVLASVNFSAATGLAVYAWFISAVDSTPNYEDGSGSVVPAKAPDVIFPLRAVNAAQRINMPLCPIPPYSFHIIVQNNVSAAFASTGNTLKYRRFYLQSV